VAAEVLDRGILERALCLERGTVGAYSLAGREDDRQVAVERERS
jgi:hypothetical protein